MIKFTKWLDKQTPLIKNLTFMLGGIIIGVTLMAIFNPGNIRHKALNAIGLSSDTVGVTEQQKSEDSTLQVADKSNSSDSGDNNSQDSKQSSSTGVTKKQGGTTSSDGGQSTGGSSDSSEPGSTPPSGPTFNCIVYTDNGTVPCPTNPPSYFVSGSTCGINASAATTPCPEYLKLNYINPMKRNTTPICEFMWDGGVYKDYIQPGTDWPTCI
jgi:hypothetical protein